MHSSRRDFLQKLTAVGLSAQALPLLANAQPEVQLEPYAGSTLNVALLGLGSYATRVAEAMKDCKMAKLVGAVSGTPSKLDEWSKKYNLDKKNLYSYQNFDSIKSNPDIDAVYVITPNLLHKEFSIRAAKAGKHVICEKPMAGNAAEAREMIAACQRAGVRLLVGYRLHFEPHTREMIRLREAGEFGKILHCINSTGFRIGDPTQWRLKKNLSGGGSLMDIGIYSLNGARYLVGEEPVWVTAQETKTDPQKFPEGVDETITFQLGFPSGVIASCTSTYAFNALDRFTLIGDKGFGELQPASGYGPTRAKTNKGPVEQPVVTHQTLQMDGMADLILNKKTISPSVDGEEGLRDMIVIDAIYEAVRTGRKVPIKMA